MSQEVLSAGGLNNLNSKAGSACFEDRCQVLQLCQAELVCLSGHRLEVVLEKK